MISNRSDPIRKKTIKPIFPFSKFPRTAPYREFIDYNSGKKLIGIEYWKSFDIVFYEYKNHLEIKFNGEKGLLNRKKIIVKNIIYIGKESNKLEESFYFGVNENNYELYIPEIKLRDKLNQFILKIPFNIAKKYEIPKRTFMDLRKKAKLNINFRINKNTLNKLNLIRKYEKIPF